MKPLSVMRRGLLLFATLTIPFFTTTVSAQGGWIQQDGAIYGPESVHFVDANNGWIVGGDDGKPGEISHTTNGGDNWIPQINPTSFALFSVFFADSNSGWIVGDDGAILHTTNGGTEWNQQTSSTTNTLYSVYFLDAANEWASGHEGIILRTTNAGIEWIVQSSSTPQSLFSVFFTCLKAVALRTKRPTYSAHTPNILSIIELGGSTRGSAGKEAEAEIPLSCDQLNPFFSQQSDVAC